MNANLSLTLLKQDNEIFPGEYFGLTNSQDIPL